MGSTFKLTVNISDILDEKACKEAAACVLELGKYFLDNSELKPIITDEIDEVWLEYSKGSKKLTACSESGFVQINPTAKIGETIVINFGKARPVTVEFIAAVFAIYCHFLTYAVIDEDADNFRSEFLAGTMLAQCINREIKCPLPAHLPANDSSDSEEEKIHSLCGAIAFIQSKQILKENFTRAAHAGVKRARRELDDSSNAEDSSPRSASIFSGRSSSASSISEIESLHEAP